MALTYSKQILSGSTNGRMVEVNNLTSPGTTVHTVQATTTNGIEEVYLYAMNAGTATSPSRLTIELGGTGTADHVIVDLAEMDGLNYLVPGVSFTATTSIIRAFATASGIFHLAGWVNRAT